MERYEDNKQEVEAVAAWGKSILDQKKVLELAVQTVNDYKYVYGKAVPKRYRFCSTCWTNEKLTIMEGFGSAWLVCEECRSKPIY